MGNLSFKSFSPKIDFNISHRKENHFCVQYTGISIDRKYIAPIETVTVRIYKTPNRIYACAWVNSLGARGSAFSGSGESFAPAAFAALRNAGAEVQEWSDAENFTMPKLFTFMKDLVHAVHPKSYAFIHQAHG